LGFEDPSKTYKKGDKYQHYYPGQDAKSSHAAAWAGALATSGGLAADDVSGAGVVDDVLIPVILGGTLVYVLLTEDDKTEPTAVTLDATADRGGATGYLY